MHLAKSQLLNDASSDLQSDRQLENWILVVTSDRGMVGSYNSNVIRITNQFIEEHQRTQGLCHFGSW